jgi:hypothetical protein
MCNGALIRYIKTWSYFLKNVFYLSFSNIHFGIAIHLKKRFKSFLSPAGMSLTKLPLGRNNSVMTSLSLPRESLVVTSWLGTGNFRTFFFRCTVLKIFLPKTLLGKKFSYRMTNIRGFPSKIPTPFLSCHFCENWCKLWIA